VAVTVGVSLFSNPFHIDYNIVAYGGTKSIVISGTSFLGDRNAFMGLAYIIFGCVCAFLGLIFLGLHFFKPR
jgi:hypothetical protein